MRFRILAAATAMLAFSFAARADSLYGSTVNVSYDFPTTSSTLTSSGNVTVTPGLTVVSEPNANLTFNGPNQITITNPGLGPFTPTAFNGFDVAFLSNILITNVTLDPASDPGFAPGVIVSFTGDDIRINLAGTCNACGSGNQNIYLDVTATTGSTATPEPSSLALLGTGVLGVVGAARRRLA